MITLVVQTILSAKCQSSTKTDNNLFSCYTNPHHNTLLFICCQYVCINKIQVRAHHIWAGTWAKCTFQGHLDLDHTELSASEIQSTHLRTRGTQFLFTFQRCKVSSPCPSGVPSVRTRSQARVYIAQAAGCGKGSYSRRNHKRVCQELAEKRGRKTRQSLTAWTRVRERYARGSGACRMKAEGCFGLLHWVLSWRL